MGIYLNIFLLILAGLAVFAFAEYLFIKKNYKSGITRKLVQMGIGLLALFLPTKVPDQWMVLLLAGLFQLFLVWSKKYGYLNSIHLSSKKTLGIMVFPIMIFLVYVVWFYSNAKPGSEHQSNAYFYLPVAIISISEPLSGFIGRKLPLFVLPKFNNTVGGLLSFFAISFIICCVVFIQSAIFNSKDIIWVSIFISGIATLTDLYNRRGMSTLFVPVSVLLGMYIAEYFF